MAPILCAASGLLGWLFLIFFLDSCDQGEQLARYFSALFNVILIGAGGGSATVLALAGFALARRSIRCGNSSARIARIVAMIAIAVGVLVSIAYLPAAFRILH